VEPASCSAGQQYRVCRQVQSPGAPDDGQQVSDQCVFSLLYR